MKMFSQKGFTLMEMIVTLAIISVLSAMILFGTTQYIARGKDSNIASNLAVLVPAGEVYYNGNSNSYQNFCDPTLAGGSVFKNAISQMPIQTSGAPCYSATLQATTNPQGVCCIVSGSGQNYQAWAACAKKFANTALAYCVDSRGIKKEIPIASCTSSITQCP